MTAPEITTVIPTFQMRRWVSEAIDSALVQRPAGEVIVVDDGSTDGTGDMLRERYGARIRYVRQENRGPSAARNAGLALARAPYTQFMDADDLITPDKVGRQVAALEAAPDYDIAYCDYARFGEGRPASGGAAVPRPSGDLLPHLLAGNFIVTHAVLARTEVVRRAGGFDESLRACEDWDLWLRLAGDGHRFLHTPGVMALYRRRDGSLSSDRPHFIRATIEVLEALELEGDLADLRAGSIDRLRDALTLALARDAGRALSRFRLATATERALRALAHDPAGWKRRAGKAVRRLVGDRHATDTGAEPGRGEG